MASASLGYPQAHQYFPAPVVRLDVIGIKFECLGKSIHRSWVVSLFSIHQAEVEMPSAAGARA